MPTLSAVTPAAASESVLKNNVAFWSEDLAKEHAPAVGLTALREAHVVSGQLTCRAWDAKLSRNEAKTQKDRS